MTLTLPPHITAATAMDALTHAVEAYTCLGKNPMSDAYAYAAIRMIAANLKGVIAKPVTGKAVWLWLQLQPWPVLRFPIPWSAWCIRSGIQSVPCVMCRMVWP